MLGTAIDLHVDCPNCAQPVWVNALSPRVPCSSCHEVVELGWERWEQLLEDSWDEIPDYVEGRGARTQTMAGAGPNSDLVYARRDPYCFLCKSKFDTARLVAERVEKFACGDCDASWTARAPSVEISRRFPKIAYLFCEAPSQIEDAFGGFADHEAGVREGSRPVVFACPACGGGLRVDGSQRMLPCEFCEASVYLPDDLWQRLHPVSKKQRWFIWWDEGGRVRNPRRFPTEEEEAAFEAERAQRSSAAGEFDDEAVGELFDDAEAGAEAGAGADARAAATATRGNASAALVVLVLTVLALGVAAGIVVFVAAP